MRKGNFRSFWISLKFFILMILLSFISNIQSASARNTYGGFETRGIILVWVELLILVVFIVTWLINLSIIHHYGRSIVGRPFIYILVGLTFLALARLYIILYNFHFYDLEEVTLQFGWHVIFYTGMISFLLSINNLDRRRLNNKLKGFTRSDFILIIGLMVINLLAYALTIINNESFARRYNGSIIDTTGSVHFLAFILSGYLALKLLNIRSTTSDDELGRLLVSFIPSFLVFLSLMSLNHFWELITESWGILNLNSKFVETIEQIFWLPGYIVTAYGLRQVRTISKNSLIYQEEELATKIHEENPPLIVDILQIMSHHIGSSALSIAIQSSTDIGIRFSDIRPNDISNLSRSVQKNTQNLIGEFPSKFLEQAIRLVSTVYN